MRRKLQRKPKKRGAKRARLTFFLDERVDPKLRQKATQEGRSVGELLREAIDAYLGD